MKYLLQILFSLILVSCSSTKRISIEKLEGKYLWNGIYGVGESITINSDSTFVFKWTQGLMNGVTHGKIKQFNNQLELNSELDKITFNYEIEIPPQTKQEYYSIMVGDTEWNRFVGATCEAYLNGNLIQGVSTNEEGICKIDSLSIDSVMIRYLGYQNAEFPILKNKTPKSLIVRLKQEDHYHYFKGDLIRIINKNTIQLETFGRNKTFKK